MNHERYFSLLIIE